MIGALAGIKYVALKILPLEINLSHHYHSIK